MISFQPDIKIKKKNSFQSYEKCCENPFDNICREKNWYQLLREKIVIGIFPMLVIQGFKANPLFLAQINHSQKNYEKPFPKKTNHFS